MQEVVKRKSRPVTMSKRIDILEAELAELKRLVQQRTPVADSDLQGWVGLFKDDPGFDEAVELGQAWRRRQPKC